MSIFKRISQQLTTMPIVAQATVVLWKRLVSAGSEESERAAQALAAIHTTVRWQDMTQETRQYWRQQIGVVLDALVPDDVG